MPETYKRLQRGEEKGRGVRERGIGNGVLGL